MQIQGDFKLLCKFNCHYNEFCYYKECRYKEGPLYWHNFNIVDSYGFLPYKRENRGKSGIKINKNISSPHPGQIQDILQTLAVENNLGLVLLFFFLSFSTSDISK